MKVIASRGNQHLAVPDDAEPGDDVDAVIVQNGDVDIVNVHSALARGYWDEPEATAEEVIPDDFDPENLADEPSEETTIKGLTDEGIEFIKKRFNVEVQ